MNEKLNKIIVDNFGELYAQKYTSEQITSKKIFDPLIGKAIEKKKGIRFHGVIGSGKTMLLVRCVEKLYEKLGIEFSNYVQIYHEQEIYELLRNKKNPAYRRIMIIDDFGSVKIPEWLLSDYEHVYFCIHSRNLILYLSTNLTEGIIQQTYPRTYSRLKEITDGYIVPGKDRRRKETE